MRARLLGIAEVLGWIAVSFSIFLALRILAIGLNLIDPAQCNESCGLGVQVLPVALLTYGLLWCPFALLRFVRSARRGEPTWFLVHAGVLVVAHAAAMVIVIRIFARYGDADTRTSILCACCALFDVLTGGALLVAALLPSLR